MTDHERFENEHGFNKRSFKTYLRRKYGKYVTEMSKAEIEVYIEDYKDFKLFNTYEKEELIDIIRKLLNGSEMLESEKSLIGYLKD